MLQQNCLYVESARPSSVGLDLQTGVYVNASNVPRALKWLPNVSMIKHCFEALCVNEFRGLDFETRHRAGDVATGEQVRVLTSRPPFWLG